jgi:hypothetical protein
MGATAPAATKNTKAIGVMRPVSNFRSRSIAAKETLQIKT